MKELLDIIIPSQDEEKVKKSCIELVCFYYCYFFFIILSDEHFGKESTYEITFNNKSWITSFNNNVNC
jgi:hypothetical protein